MSLFSRLSSLWTNLAHRDRVEQDLDAELRAMHDLLVQEKVQGGMRPGDARRAVTLEFGRIESVKERVRDIRAGAIVERCLRDARDAVRTLRRSPGLSITAVLTLALGIGANTAVLSVVDAVLLSPLPYTQPDRLVAVSDAHRSRPAGGVAPGNLADYQAARSFAGVAGYNRVSMSLTKSGTPEQVLGEAVTWNLLEVLGVSPAIGRSFRRDEDRAGGGRVVILMHSFWERRFDADPAVLGRTLILNDDPYVVIGVMPDGFIPLSQSGSGFTIELLVPAAYSHETLANRSAIQVSVVGRLARRVSIEQAQAELQSVSADLARQFPDTNRDVTAIVVSLRDELVRDEVRLSLIVMLGAVGLVLLIACVNLANLLVVHAIGQQREVATRLALGATRGQIIFALAVRGLLLGFFGGTAGVIGGSWLRNLLVSLAPPSLPGLEHLGLSPRVLAVTIVISLVAGTVASVLPALQIWRGDATAALQGSGRTVSASRPITRWRGSLMSAEIAAALILMVGTILLVRSLIQLNNVELGFRTDGVLMFTLRLPDAHYPDQTTRKVFFERLEEQVRAIQGVDSFAVTDALPMRGGRRKRVTLAGAAASGSTTADFQVVSPGYFPTLRIPVVRGRLPGTQDRTGTEPVAVVSEALVRRFFSGRNPIGQRIRLEPSVTDVVVIGVVGDVRRGGRHTALTPQVYVPSAQSELYTARLTEVGVRATGDPLALVPGIRRAVSAIDPDQPITHVQELDDVAAGSMAGRRFNMMLLGALASLAVGLALVGTYGVMAHAAAQRTGEMGIRIALGARPRDVVLLTVASGMRWAMVGVAAGLVGAYRVTRFMAGLLFGVAPTDVITFTSAVVFVIGVACIASYVPARRVAGVDPVSALRSQ